VNIKIPNFFKRKKRSKKERKVLTISEFMKEFGLAREGVLSSYETEENPDELTPEDYIQMQSNDGEIQAIVRLLTLPIISTPIHILPAEGDKGERDFIEMVFMNPPGQGGMTTPLPFIVADMTRAIFEGFRLYEKVARIIPDGKYKGKVGWKKLAPRDAQTITLKPDKHGGFAGAHQDATFGGETVSIDFPPEKCLLFTFQKEKHWLYGESILKTAWYHYDKKHKLYYLTHKKAELDTLGLKILKIGQTTTPQERERAEEVVDTLGVNSRVTLPPGIELEIQRGGEKGFDPLPLIEHHNSEMSKSALVQVLDQIKYAYPYGKGTQSSQYATLSIQSIMNQMESTLNTYAVAPLIDWNFGSQAYPRIEFEKITGQTAQFLETVFSKIADSKRLPDGFVDEVIDETARNLKLKWIHKKEEETEKRNKNLLKSFEEGKRRRSDELKINAPKTPQSLKDSILNLKPGPDLEIKCFKLGQKYADGQKKKNLSQMRN